MENTAFKVLVVDDDKFAQKLIVRTLQSRYELKTASDGAEAVIMAAEWLPDVVLLDVEMPLKNGYETCEILKQQDSTKTIPVIFLSGKSSIREKMLGFELGAEDYLVKPFEPDELNAKVKLAITSYHEKRQLNKLAQSAQSNAFEALTISAELGRALRFAEHTYAINSFEDLAKSLFKSMNDFGLRCSVMFVTLGGALFFSHGDADVPPLEKDLLQLMHNQGRFSDFGCRTFCNFRQVALLIKNMPLENRELYGRIKDTVPFILGAVDGKVRSLDIQKSLVQQATSLSQSIEAIGATLNALTQQVSTGQNAISTVMKNLLRDLGERLPKLGLEDDQENYLLTRIDSAFTETLDELDRSEVLGQSLQGVVRLLQHLKGQQEKMITQTEIKPDVMNSDMPNDGDVLSNDVELF